VKGNEQSFGGPNLSSSATAMAMEPAATLVAVHSSMHNTGDDEGSTGQAEDADGHLKSVAQDVLFTQTEILALRLMFSLYDRSGSDTIEYEDLVAYAEETGDTAGIRDAGIALNIIDIDGDGKIGLLDFFHFAARLKSAFRAPSKPLA